MRQSRDNTPSPYTQPCPLGLIPHSFSYGSAGYPPHTFLMALTPQDIDRLAKLARLELTGSESERMLTQLNGFFATVDQMRAVNTEGVEPLTHPVAAIQPVALRLRPDVPSEPNQREANQQSAPAVERGLFLVPKVIE